MRYPIVALILALSLPARADEPRSESAGGVLPVDASGRSLNLDFETGDLRDWTAAGEAFAGQPVEGDTVNARRSDMHSRHQGRFWACSFEGKGDGPKGTLTSVPFRVTKPFASFLVAGGMQPTSRVEIVRKDSGRAIYGVSGDDTEELKRVAIDLTSHVGHDLFIRLVDDASGGWGHINFDDFRLHEAKPDVPARSNAMVPDVYAHAGLDPEEAAKAMTVPPGFKVTLFAGEPDVVQPIAFCLDDRGRLWVAEAYSYPRRVPDDQAKDRILIFEDTDHDGRFDQRKVFIEKLNLVSGLEVGFGGVWVGAAPELLFIPDSDRDDRPDGPAKVLLDGWGQQDTHETLNSFIWGPDGWLYGCHGVFTHSFVGKPGASDEERTPINAGIWRYHPTRHQFEVFAHGTSNPWGFDWNDRGQSFLTACVIPHLYQIVPNGRYERQAGQHFNPYTYDDIKTNADHRHYVGPNPHAGNLRSSSAGGGHAHAGAMFYLGGTWPAEYRDSLFMNNIHGARLNRDVLTSRGSGYVGSHAPDFLLANDSWSQIINFRYGPDGNVFLIDWYDKNQCHRNETELHDRTNGRIFKVSYGEPRKIGLVNLASRPSEELVDHLLNANEWYVRHARRVLQERGPDESLRRRLAAIAFDNPDETRRLRGLWGLFATGNFDADALARGLADASPHVRGWTVRLLCDSNVPNLAMRKRLTEVARSDPSPVVRLALAAVLQKFSADRRWEILEALLAHGEDADDPNLPLMLWYAAEPLADDDPARAARLASSSAIPRIPMFMARRIASTGKPETLAMIVEELGKVVREAGPNRRAAPKLSLLVGLNEALKGRRRVDMPAAWPAVFEALVRDVDPQVRSQATVLALTFGDKAALQSMRAVLTDRAADAALRREALAALLKVRDPELAPTLRRLIADPELRGPALRGLAGYDDPEAAEAILKAYGSFSPAERRDALGTLAARAASARALLEAVGAETVPRNDLTADLVRQLRGHKDAQLDELITKVWGNVRETSEDRAAAIAHFKADLQKDAEKPVDRSFGRAVFAKVCTQCHTLFGTGAKVGPELTGSNRADLDYILSNVLDPSALIGKDYQAHTVATTDGRVLIGLIKAEDQDAITLVTANETLTLPKGEIEERKLSDQSMMPDDLLKPLAWEETRALIAYLASPNQVPMLVTAENASTLFNGRDLTGWTGDPALWSVEDGEIVGRSRGLDHNEFLKSDLLAGDFKLTLQVKLVRNEGNSGIQFRSEALPEGTEVKGYQADIGAGWWGKLYEEHGRGLLWDKSGEAHVKPGDWNTYEIEAIGSKITTRINGQMCVDLDDPSGARRGIFALQLHSGGPTEVRFRELKLEPITAAPPAGQ